MSTATITFQDRIQAIVDDISLVDPNQRVVFERDKKDPNGRFYLQVCCTRPDTFTGEMGEGGGRKAYLTEHVSKSEVVGTVMGLLLAYVEHEAREGFLYKGRRVYGPHIDVDALWEVAERTDARQQVDLNPDPAAPKVPEEVQRIIDDQNRYTAAYRDQSKRLRDLLTERDGDDSESARLVDEKAETHHRIAFTLGTLPFADAEVEIRAQLDDMRAEQAEADAADDTPGVQRAAVLADIWVCALNEFLDVKRQRATS